MLGPDPEAERQALADSATHTLWRQDIIRFADLDILGHVNNVAYMVFFETGRVAFLEQLGRPPADREHGPVFVLAHVAADYLAELYYPGTVEIGTALRRVGSSSFHLGHGIFHEGECKAIATSVIVQVQGRPLRHVELTDEQKARIRRVADV
ncbi:MAG: acyl-CoA thioesterase [Halofilum sp. (in: g-proteobacteria)]